MGKPAWSIWLRFSFFALSSVSLKKLPYFLRFGLRFDLNLVFFFGRVQKGLRIVQKAWRERERENRGATGGLKIVI